MWLITNFGFFSIVEKPNQRGTGMLTVRARAKADLETLRAKYLPELQEIKSNVGTDYAHRAAAPATAVAEAFAKALREIDYDNFKNSVYEKQGSHRHDVYAKLWTTLRQVK